MDSLFSLNKQQKDAVTFFNGPVLILAGAGSGKTNIIIQRIAYLIQKKNISPKKILAVTFTNKAAQEMKDRLAKILQKKRNQVHLSTFHSFGVSLLRKSIYNLGYS